MRLLAMLALALALLTGCGAEPLDVGRPDLAPVVDLGYGGANDTCTGAIYGEGEVENGACTDPGASCSYSTWEWDFGCACTSTSTGLTWVCCSTDADYFGYGCANEPPADGDVCCTGACDYPDAQQRCTCEGRIWHCVTTVSDGGESSDGPHDAGTD